MIRKPVEIAAPQSTRVEVEKPWIVANLLQTDLELPQKVVTQLMGDGIILVQDLVQVSLNATMKLSDHGGSDLQPIDRK